MSLKPVIRKDAIIECEHGGKVILDACQPQFKVEDVPLLVLEDLVFAPISGCTLSEKKGGPCTHVSVVPTSCASTRSFVYGKWHLMTVANAQTDKGAALCLIDPAQYRYKASESETKNPEVILVEEKACRLYFAWQQPEIGDEPAPNLVAPRTSGVAGDPLFPDFSNEEDFPVFADNPTRVTTGLKSYLHLNVDGVLVSYEIRGEEGMPLYQRVGQTSDRPLQTHCIPLAQKPANLSVAFSLDETPPTTYTPVNLGAEPVNDEVTLPYLRIGMRYPLSTSFVLGDHEGASIERDQDYLIMLEASPYEQLLYRQARQRQQFSAAVLHNHRFFEQLKQGHAHAFTCLNVIDSAYQTEVDQQTVENLHETLTQFETRFWDRDFYTFLQWLDNHPENQAHAFDQKSERRKVLVGDYNNDFQAVTVERFLVPFDLLLSEEEQHHWQQLIPMQAALDIERHFITKDRMRQYGLFLDALTAERNDASHLVMGNAFHKDPTRRDKRNAEYCELTFSLLSEAWDEEKGESDAERRQHTFMTKMVQYPLLFGVLYQFYRDSLDAEGFELLKQSVRAAQVYANHHGASEDAIKDVVNTVNGNKRLKALLDPIAMGIEDKNDNFLAQYRQLILSEQTLAYAPPVTPYTVKLATEERQSNPCFSSLSHLLPKRSDLAQALFPDFEFYCQQPSTPAKEWMAQYGSTEGVCAPHGVNKTSAKPLDITLTPVVTHQELSPILSDYVTLTPATLSKSIDTLLEESEIKELLTQQAKKTPENNTLEAKKALLFEHISLVMPFLLPVTQVTEEIQHYWGAKKAHLPALINLVVAIKALDDQFWGELTDTFQNEADNQTPQQGDISAEQAKLYQAYMHHMLNFISVVYFSTEQDLSALLPNLPMISSMQHKDPKAAREAFAKAIGNLSKVYKIGEAHKLLDEIERLDEKLKTSRHQRQLQRRREAASARLEALFPSLDTSKVQSSDPFDRGQVDLDALKESQIRNMLDKLNLDPSRKQLIENVSGYLNGGALVLFSLAMLFNNKDEQISLEEGYGLSTDLLSGLVIMSEQRYSKALMQSLASKVGTQAWLAKGMQGTEKAQKALGRLLNARGFALVGLVIALSANLNSVEKGDRSTNMVTLLQFGVNLGLLFLSGPFLLPAAIVINIGFMLWLSATEESSFEEFVKRSLWYQEDKDALLFPDDYVPYLQEYLGEEYDSQDNWLASNSDTINEINSQALELWQQKGEHGYFESHDPLTDFLLANYLNPSESESVEESRARLSQALNYELNNWSSINSDYKINLVQGWEDQWHFQASPSLLKHVTSITVFLKNQQGEWGKHTLTVNKNDKDLFVLPEQVGYSNYSRDMEADTTGWWSEVVFVCTFDPKAREGIDERETLYFKAQGKIISKPLQDSYGREMDVRMRWSKGLVYDGYLPHGELAEMFTSGEGANVPLSIGKSGYLTLTNQ